MEKQYDSVRREVHQTAMDAAEADLIYLSTGNVSARTIDGNVAITPSGVRYKHLRPDQISIVDENGNWVDSPCKPSSETPMHTYIYRHMPDVNAVVHTHSSYAIAFAMLGETVPTVNLEMFLCGAPVPVAPWTTPGTESAGMRVTELMQRQLGLKVVLLRNHGLVAVGETLEEAFDAAYHAEMGMKAYHLARQIGHPSAIAEKYVSRIKEAYQAK